MVVCKCRKATNLYCFVHEVPVCGECICSSEHHMCVVRTYSEWVIDGDYDWPPKCSVCHEILQSGEAAVSRLGCLHVLHLACFSKHLQSYPAHTAPAGYTCPVCPAPIWPPKNVKDHNCALSSRLKEIILQNGLNKTLFGSDVIATQRQAPPHAFASAPLAKFSSSNHAGVQTVSSANSLSESQEIQDAVTMLNSGAMTGPVEAVDGANRAHSSLTNIPTIQPGAMTRKNSARAEKVGLNHGDYDGEDEDETSRKYSRRGSLQKQVTKYLIPFSPNVLPSLPITSPSRKDIQTPYAEEIIEGRQRRRSRSSGLNTKKVLLVIAIMSCMVTMVLLYYRLTLQKILLI